MAFKKSVQNTAVAETPDELFLDLPRRTISSVASHQKEIMRSYVERALESSDVALQLPMGSGKTLVGLLMGEWLRLKNNERVVYLCPTNQLVRQVVELAENHYGLSVVGFTGPKSEYINKEKALYQSSGCIAVTTYSSVFNVNPFFSDANVIIADDVHAAEGYISGMWSVDISRDCSAHEAMQSILRPHIDPVDHAKMSSESEHLIDPGWVNKVPSPVLLKIKDEIRETLDVHLKDEQGWYSWSMIRDDLHACHIYYSNHKILIRPLIPPTWTHESFTSPRQRIFMSATLGEGGDLERMVGRSDINRLPIPDGMDRHGIGRRLFLFPGASLDDDESQKLNVELIKVTKKCLALLPSNASRDRFVENVEEGVQLPIYDAADIKEDKNNIKEGVIAVANRYDGIDFAGNECRLLFVEGVPKAVNLQERFLMSRMAATIIFNERIRTRVLQALGRCTRSMEDYSAIIVSGEEMQSYLMTMKEKKYLHPELQAEIAFGIDQSMGVNIENFQDNFEIFIKNDKEWEEANRDIVSLRDSLEQESFPARDELGNIAAHEIEYQKKILQSDYSGAIGAAQKALGGLDHDDLAGYRAFWYYLAGCAAFAGGEGTKDKRMTVQAYDYFEQARKATKGVQWMASLTRTSTVEITKDNEDGVVLEQVEKLEQNFTKYGIVHDRKFAKHEKEIMDGLSNEEGFEQAQKLLGEVLGFEAGKVEADGSPDPWWVSGDICIVFEDYVGATGEKLSTKKARQVQGHPNWIRKNMKEYESHDILSVLISPSVKVMNGAIPHLDDVLYWSVDDFIEWAKESLSVIRELKESFRDAGDLNWREVAMDKLVANEMDIISISKKLQDQKALNILELADSVKQ